MRWIADIRFVVFPRQRVSQLRWTPWCLQLGRRIAADVGGGSRRVGRPRGPRCHWSPVAVRNTAEQEVGQVVHVSQPAQGGRSELDARQHWRRERDSVQRQCVERATASEELFAWVERKSVGIGEKNFWYYFFHLLVPQKAGDSPQHMNRGATAASNSSSQGEGGQRVAMLRRSLREISQSVIQQRVQQHQRANLNLDHLAPGEVSDSFERRMLADMKAENEEEDEEMEKSKSQKLSTVPTLQLRNSQPVKMASCSVRVSYLCRCFFRKCRSCLVVGQPR